MLSGFININKPSGITSHDVIFHLRRSTRIKRMGHCGTLDPDATGVLPVAIGSSCRLIDYLARDKVYFAEIMLGIRTNTDDSTGRVLEKRIIDPSLTRDHLLEALRNFIGTIEQRPPLYSAVHHNGQRLHHLARLAKHRNADANAIDHVLSRVKKRQVLIDKIELLSAELPVLSLRITCSAGTYIRSLARDLGDFLGSGACLKSLCREKSGLFELSHSIDLDSAISSIAAGNLKDLLIDPAQVLGFRTVKLDQQSTAEILNGRYVNLNLLMANAKKSPETFSCEASPDPFKANEQVLMLCDQPEYTSQIVGLARVCDKQILKPEIVLLPVPGLN